ncbi:MAG: HU family DNA-binding protein [Lactovum sp.]
MANKQDVVAAVAKEAGLTKKDAEKAVNAFTEVIKSELQKGEKVQLIGFGTFETRERAAREGRNPRTGKKIKIEATTVPAFKAGKALKDIVK